MWYGKIYRRHLCDMHIDDWDNRFLSEFSPKEYFGNLKLAQIQNAMIYLQSHAGLCYYPTKTGQIHKAFIGREDMIKRLIDMCREDGMKVTGYYSLNYNTREHDLHKSWRMLEENGRSQRENDSVNGKALSFASVRQGRYGLCCPNNYDYRSFVYGQIDEMLEYFDLDGMFFDMPFWPHTCYCDKCRERWKNEVGGEMPVNPNTNTEEYKKLIRKKYQWMGEWIRAVTDYVKSKNPKLSVEHNFASAIAGYSDNGCGEEVNEASDFVGGDLYGGIINHSLACKFYKNITKNMPFDYMFSRCKPALRMHTLTKSPDEMKAEVMLTAAHHGATMVIDAIDPIGTLDKRVYERIGDVFDYEKKYEPYLNGKMREDIGVYYSIRSRFPNGKNNKTSVTELTKTLAEKNIPFGITGNFHDFSDCKALIVPLITDMEEVDNDRLLQYINNGGNAYISGAANKKLIEELLDCRVKGMTKENNLYLAPKIEYEKMFNGFNGKYPLPFETAAPIIEMNGGGIIAATITLPYTEPDDIHFASIHSNPPGRGTDIPSVVIGRYGKGRIIWSALDIEGMGICDYKEIFLNMLSELIDINNLSFRSSAPEEVEITVFDSEALITVNTVVLNERMRAKKILPFEVSVRCKSKPQAVYLLPEKEKISFSYDGEFVTFRTRALDIFDMYGIELFK